MRHRIQVAALCMAVGAVNACSEPETVITTTAIPSAGVRFINAVPDSAGAYGLDFRFIDIVENSAQFRVLFRNAISASTPFVSTLTEYKPAQEGSRRFRIFLDDTIPAIAATVVKDSTVNLVATHNYTAILMGSGRSTGADRMRLAFWDETVADPGTQIAIRVVNTTSSPIEARIYTQGGTAPAAATIASIPAFSPSSYVTLAANARYMVNIQPAGGGTALAADALLLGGQAGTVDIEAQPGTLVAGTALTAWVFPRSTAGSRAPQSTAAPSFAAPSISSNWDRRPPRTCALC